MRVVTTFAAAREAAGAQATLVPTMGFFHEGHLALMERARKDPGTVMVSLFVNPTQFDDPADLDRYPRDPDRDMALAEEARVDVLFSPKVEEVYPAGGSTVVGVETLGEVLEGVHRPGHLQGVATVVAKLFAGLQPRRAVFGRKDAQQLAVVRRLAGDLRMPVEVIGHPTVREPDGLALSSRNVLLDRPDRERALGLSRGLFQAADQIEAGETRGRRLEEVVAKAARHTNVEYVALVDMTTMAPLDALDRHAVLAVAAEVGPVRLIDNLAIDFVSSPAPDRGSILEKESILYER